MVVRIGGDPRLSHPAAYPLTQHSRSPRRGGGRNGPRFLPPRRLAYRCVYQGR